MEAREERAIVFFDGVCNFCNGSVRFIMKRDRAGYFRFAPLQSAAARARLAARPELLSQGTVVLYENGAFYTESAAVLRIARRLDGLWKLAWIGMIVPRPLRDAAYRYVSRHRYRWFGKRESCMLPTAEQRERFIDADA